MSKASNAYLTYEVYAIGLSIVGIVESLPKNPERRNTGAIERGAKKTAFSTLLT